MVRYVGGLSFRQNVSTLLSLSHRNGYNGYILRDIFQLLALRKSSGILACRFLWGLGAELESVQRFWILLKSVEK